MDECLNEYMSLSVQFREISGEKDNYDIFSMESLHDPHSRVEGHIEELIIRYGHDPMTRLESYQFKRPRV